MRRLRHSLAGLRLPGKFGVLAAVFGLPLALLTLLLFTESQRGIGVAGQERRGLEYVTHLATFLHAVQAHGVAAMHAPASPEAARALDAATATTDNALAEWRAVDARLGPPMGTGERAQNLVDHWTAMKSRQRKVSAERSLMEHRALSEGILDLMYFVAERSRLLLDPEPRSAYLQDVSVARLPELVASVGQATALMAAGGERQAALAMAYQLATKSLDASNRGFANAFGGSDVVVDDARFTAARAALERSASGFLEAVSARVRNDAAAPAPQQAVALGTAALDDAARLDLATLGLLEREIAARAAGERRAQLFLLGGVLASLLLSAALLVLLSRSITASLRDAMGLAGRISEGDLTQRIERRTGDEIGDLVDSLNRMSERMTGLIAGVKESSAVVVSSTEEVAHSNEELSLRTERQASSLEEMAASTEELSAAVGQSSGKIEQAATLVAGASKASELSNTAMSRAMETMNQVESSSRRIADISAVIDGIAFQTNILALNAAVEAARVGAAGRGFAVVAGEIRLLSQRSATAAHEIKTLIAEAVAAIEAGGALVGDAGRSLVASVDSIRSAAAIMHDVGAMAREQSASIGQISTAVQEMNGVTQQNAAFVQQTSRIANRQSEYADRLTRSIGGFRIAAHAPVAVAPPARAALDAPPAAPRKAPLRRAWLPAARA